MFFYLPGKLQLDAYKTYQENNKLSVASIIKEYFLAEKITEETPTVFTPDKTQLKIRSLYDLKLNVTYELKLHDDFPNVHFYLARTHYDKMMFRLHCTPPPKRPSELQTYASDDDSGSFDSFSIAYKETPADETLDCTVEGIELQCLKGEEVVFWKRASMQFDENTVNANAAAASKMTSSGGGGETLSKSSGSDSSSSSSNSGNDSNLNSENGNANMVNTAAADLDYSYGFIDGTFYVTNFRCVFVPFKFVNTSEFVLQDMRYSGFVVGNTVLNSNYMGANPYTQEMAEPDALSRENEAWDELLHLKNRPIWFPIKAIAKARENSTPKSSMPWLWSFWPFSQEDPSSKKILRIVLSPYYRCTLYGTFFFLFENEVLCSSACKAVRKGMEVLNKDSFPFKFGGLEEDNESKSCRIRDFDVKKEFEREGLVFDDNDNGDGAENENNHNFAHKWRITKMNINYDVTKTYQRVLCVPKVLTDKELIEGSEFRTKKRIPVASYIYRNGASITRGSQPRTGAIGSTNKVDIKLITAIREANPAKSLHIIDCRPYLNAFGNALMGGGTETGAYEMCKVEFLNIPNMIDVSKTFNSLREAFYLEAKGVSRMAIAMQGLKWNQILQLILMGARKVVTLIAVHNTSTFIHCSDAWDRTAQLCSLAQLCLDPWFRTMEGFGVLVEKEWLRMGHKFHDRTDPDSTNKESSPVFLQFLDCVYQIMAQFPAAFEFTEDFLIDLYDEIVYGRYGNFYCNCDKERNDLELPTKTYSLWSKLLGDREKYLNSLYVDPFERRAKKAEKAEGKEEEEEEEEEEEKGMACGNSMGDSREDGVSAPVLDEIFEVSSTKHSVKRDEERGRAMRGGGVICPKVESYNIVFWEGFYRKFVEGSPSP